MTLSPRFDPYRAAMVPSVIPLAKAAEPEMPPVVYTLLGVPYTVVPDRRHGFLFKAARRKPSPGQMSLFDAPASPKAPKAPGTGKRKKMQEGATRIKNGQQQVLKNSRWRNVEPKDKATPKPGLAVVQDEPATVKSQGGDPISDAATMLPHEYQAKYGDEYDYEIQQLSAQDRGMEIKTHPTLDELFSMSDKDIKAWANTGVNGVRRIRTFNGTSDPNQVIDDINAYGLAGAEKKWAIEQVERQGQKVPQKYKQQLEQIAATRANPSQGGESKLKPKPKARKGKAWGAETPAKAPAAVGSEAMGATSLRPKAKPTLPKPLTLGDEDIFEKDEPKKELKPSVSRKIQSVISAGSKIPSVVAKILDLPVETVQDHVDALVKENVLTEGGTTASGLKWYEYIPMHLRESKKVVPPQNQAAAVAQVTPATPVAAEVVADDEPTTLRPKIRSRAERQKGFDDLKNTMQDAARSAIRGAAEVADFYENTVAAVAEGMGVGDDLGEVGGNRAMAEAMLAERDPLQAEPTTLRPKRTRAERKQDFDGIKQNLYDAGVSTVQAAQTVQQMGDTAAGAVADAYGLDLDDDAGLGGTNAPQLEPTLGDMPEKSDGHIGFDHETGHEYIQTRSGDVSRASISDPIMPDGRRFARFESTAAGWASHPVKKKLDGETEPTLGDMLSEQKAGAGDESPLRPKSKSSLTVKDDKAIQKERQAVESAISQGKNPDLYLAKLFSAHSSAITERHKTEIALSGGKETPELISDAHDRYLEQMNEPNILPRYYNQEHAKKTGNKDLIEATRQWAETEPYRIPRDFSASAASKYVLAAYPGVFKSKAEIQRFINTAIDKGEIEATGSDSFKVGYMKHEYGNNSGTGTRDRSYIKYSRESVDLLVAERLKTSLSAKQRDRKR